MASISTGPFAVTPNFNEWVRDVPSGTNGTPVYTLSVDPTMAVRAIGIDIDGNEIVRGTKQGNFASAAWTPGVGGTGYEEGSVHDFA